jgi:glycosyltransferase involved in cell wall biosynthesis
MLPFESEITLADDYLMYCDNMMIMTICETEPVNEAYKLIADRYPVVYVASDYCKEVFTKQFPGTEWRVMHLFAPSPQVYRPPKADGPYVFYTIGNIADPRKNINSLLKAFQECQFPNARLLLKATCNQDVKVEIPGVTVINGLISLEQMENIHAQGHCYINCSHSEGVGMGAVEAALRAKPVIITDYGGLKEYVKTPWVIGCTKGPIGFDDFLFKAEHEWGHPNYQDLVTHMKDCYTKQVKTWDHAHTQKLMDAISFSG